MHYGEYYMDLEKYTIGICDDEIYWQNELVNSCKCVQHNTQVQIDYVLFSSGEELLKNKLHLDILFLDEEMQNISGQMIRDFLEEHNINTMIVFVTSHEEILYDSFGKNVYGFLNKPIVLQKLEKIMDKLLNKLGSMQYITVPDSIYGEQKIICKNILYIHAEGNYVRIVLENSKEYCIRKNLNEMRQILHYRYIVCVHKSYLVNLCHCCKLSTTASVLILKTGVEIPIARRRKKEVQKLYLEIIKNRADLLWEP